MVGPQPISRIKVGDRVMATNVITGRTEPETVTATNIHRDDDLLDVYVRDDGRVSVIQATDLHPFWDITTGQWTLAHEMKVGDQLRTTGGPTVTLVKAVSLAGSQQMWDLTVGTDHDFYVSVGVGSQTAVLVHNCPDSGDIHGDLNSESRGIDVDNVRANGDTAYQVSESETRAVNIVNNGNGTNDVVIDRLGAQAGDSPITAFQSTDDEVAGKFASGTWQWNLGG